MSPMRLKWLFWILKDVGEMAVSVMTADCL